jgi:hypothetical protein
MYQHSGARKFRNGEGITSGVLAHAKRGSHNMAASSAISARSVKSSTSKTRQSGPKPITREESVQLLQSAVSYMQRAGLSVLAENSQQGLILTFPGVLYGTNNTGNEAAFFLGVLDPLHPEPEESANTIGKVDKT